MAENWRGGEDESVRQEVMGYLRGSSMGTSQSLASLFVFVDLQYDISQVTL